MTVGAFQLSGGWIEVIAGVMFSGKSEELMRRVRRALIARKRVQVFKSHLDDRYGGVYAVGSHDGRTIEAIPVDSSEQIALRLDPLAQVVAVDEVQFLDVGIVPLANSLAARGRRVILAGTDTDFRGAVAVTESVFAGVDALKMVLQSAGGSPPGLGEALERALDGLRALMSTAEMAPQTPSGPAAQRGPR